MQCRPQITSRLTQNSFEALGYMGPQPNGFVSITKADKHELANQILLSISHTSDLW